MVVYWSCAALAYKGALPSLWGCDRCAYIRMVDASLFQDRYPYSSTPSYEVEKRASSVCTAVTDIFKSAAAGPPRLMGCEPVFANSEVNSPKMKCKGDHGQAHSSWHDQFLHHTSPRPKCHADSDLFRALAHGGAHQHFSTGANRPWRW